MHLFLLMRGIKKEFDDAVNHLQTQYYPIERTDVDTGNKHTIMVQGSLRPIQLFEYIIPETAYDMVMTSLELTGVNEKGYWGEKKGAKAKYALPLLRKALGARPCPKVNKSDMMKIISRKGVGIEPIGVKDDGQITFDYEIDAHLIPAYKSQIGKKFTQEAL